MLVRSLIFQAFVLLQTKIMPSHNKTLFPFTLRRAFKHSRMCLAETKKLLSMFMKGQSPRYKRASEIITRSERKLYLRRTT
jgi:hypothetical protein